MISTKAKKLFTRIVRAGYFTGVSIVGQMPGSDKLVCSRSSVYRAWVCIQMGMALLYECFLCYQVWLTATNPEKLTKQNIRILSVTVATVMLNCNHAINLFRPQEYVTFVNGYRQLMQDHIDTDHPCQRSIRYMKTVSFICVFVTLTNSIATIRNPASPQLLTSLAANPKELPFFPYKALAMVLQAVCNGFHMYAFCLQVSTVFSYAHDLSEAVGKMKPPARVTPAKAIKFAMLNRELSVLQAHFRALYANYVFIIVTAAQMVVILNVYLAVVERAERSLVLAMAISVSVRTFLEHMSEVHKISTVVLGQWKNPDPSQIPPWFPRLIKSCRQICIPFGSFFFADKGLVLTVCSTVIQSSASLILAN